MEEFSIDEPVMFIHGLVSSGQGSKAKLLRGRIPGILTPDFTGSLDERMGQLEPILARKPSWVLIGSSFGGLMAATYAISHTDRVSRLILLAPALILLREGQDKLSPIPIPTVVFHGSGDTVVPLEPVREICEQLFSDLTFHVVDDDHRLMKTARGLDWQALVNRA